MLKTRSIRHAWGSTSPRNVRIYPLLAATIVSLLLSACDSVGESLGDALEICVDNFPGLHHGEEVVYVSTESGLDYRYRLQVSEDPNPDPDSDDDDPSTTVLIERQTRGLANGPWQQFDTITTDSETCRIGPFFFFANSGCSLARSNDTSSLLMGCFSDWGTFENSNQSADEITTQNCETANSDLPIGSLTVRRCDRIAIIEDPAQEQPFVDETQDGDSRPGNGFVKRTVRPGAIDEYTMELEAWNGV